MNNIITVLHNTLSNQRVIDFVSTSISLGVNTIILTKVGGTAAQIGIPEAFKQAIKNNAKLIVLPDINDIKSVFEKAQLYFFVQKEYAKEEFNVNELFELYKNGFQPILIFGGLEPGFNKKELELGKAVHLNIGGNIPSVSLAAIVLFIIKHFLEGQNV